MLNRICSGLSILLLFMNSAWADISHRELKGVHSLFSSQYDYLSPVFGYTVLASGVLKNRRFYGNYGPKKPGFGCLEGATRIHELLEKNEDCPQDSMSELLQRLFPSQDRINLVPNQVDSDILSKLSGYAIGKILGSLAVLKDSDLADETKRGHVIEMLKNRAFESQNPKGYYQKLLLTLNKRLKQRGLTQDDSLKLTNEIQHIQDLLAVDTSNAKVLGKEKDFQHLAEVIVGAVVESRSEGQTLAFHLPEEALIAFFLKKENQKEDFLPLFQGIFEEAPQAFSDSDFFENEDKKNAFLDQHYTKKDYDQFIQDTEAYPHEVLESYKLLERPEEFVFYAIEQINSGRLAPQVLTYRFANYTNLMKEDKKFPDCGETSVRNFFNYILFNSKEGRFDSRYFNQMRLDHPRLSFRPELVAFYEKYQDPANATSQRARDEWSATVISSQKGVNYHEPFYNPTCHLSSAGSGIDNTIRLLEELIIYPPSKGIKSRSQHLDQICKLLSREGFELTWGLRRHSSADAIKRINKLKYADIEFRVNGTPRFQWELRPGHFGFDHIREDQFERSWLDLVAHELSHSILFYKDKFSKIPLNHFPLLYWLERWETHPSFVNWTEILLGSTSSRFKPDEVSQKRQILTSGALYYGLPLSSDEIKLLVIQEIVSGKEESLYPLAVHLERTLATDDINIRQQFQIFMANHEYPWGLPDHTPSGIQYKNRSHETALTQLHGESFENAWQDPRGLIWGGLGSKGKMVPFSFADKYCKKMQARLPTRQDWKSLGKDMDLGPPTHYFLPMYLSGFKREMPYWTSSLSRPSRKSTFFIFEDKFKIEKSPSGRPYRASFRCVADP